MTKIITKSANIAGPTLTIMAGVHGNERVGVEAVSDVIDTLTIEAGTVHFIYANPPAIEQGQRLVEKNLNRCFYTDNEGTALEDRYAREIMSVLDRSDALLDLHASMSRRTTPFVICEREAFGIAERMPVPIISYGWDQLEEGASDGYMHRQHKPGVCVECGSTYEPERNRQVAREAIRQFLAFFGVRGKEGAEAGTGAVHQEFVRVYDIAYKHTENFAFSHEFGDFDRLPSGQVFATDGQVQYVAQKGDMIIFPRPDAPIGAEAFLRGVCDPTA